MTFDEREIKDLEDELAKNPNNSFLERKLDLKRQILRKRNDADWNLALHHGRVAEAKRRSDELHTEARALTEQLCELIRLEENKK
jgi:hypothetical protein